MGWDPWMAPEDQVTDPLFNCNGEISYNLWVGGWPQKIGSSPSPSASGPQTFSVGGWIDENSAPVCPSVSTGTPRDNVVLNSNSITFNWSPPECDGIDYFTFRVSNHSDIDNGPWIFNEQINKGATSIPKIIPNLYNGQTLYWSIWTHNNAGKSEKSGPWTFKIDTSAPPPPPPLPVGAWNVSYFRNKELTDQCGTTSFDRTFIFSDWGEGAPAGGCNSDNWGARFTRRVYFAGGNYTFGLKADDWGRIFVDNSLVVDKWNGGSQVYEGRALSSGEHDIRVEFADTAGLAKISAWWWGPGFNVPHEDQDIYQWYANYWLNPSLWEDSFEKLMKEPAVYIMLGEQTARVGICLQIILVPVFNGERFLNADYIALRLTTMMELNFYSMGL